MVFDRHDLKSFQLKPLGNSERFGFKWVEFLTYLLERTKVAVIKLDEWEIFIPPPDQAPAPDLRINAYYRPKMPPPGYYRAAPIASGEHLFLSSAGFRIVVLRPKPLVGFVCRVVP